MNAPVLSIENLSIELPQVGDRRYAVNEVSLTIDSGKTLCVVGESGSGKSVVASAVMGLLPKGLVPRSGAIRLRGESLLDATAKRYRTIRGQEIGMVFQEPMTALNPVMTCGRQLDELLTRHTTWGWRQRREEILKIFERVRLPHPERIYAAYPHQLSGGQRQRIVIAAAVILKPGLLICDEPTTALDVTTQKEILDLIATLQAEQGSAVLFITHDMSVVADIADEVLVLKLGSVVEYGSRGDVLRRPSQEYTRRLLAAVPSLTPPPPRPLPHAEPVLRGAGVQKIYKSRDWKGSQTAFEALKPTTIRLQPRETLGIVGESGSGKSTLARCIIRMIDPSAGEIFWQDAEVASAPERHLRPLRHRIQVVFQDPNRSLNPRRKVGDSIVEGSMNFGASRAEAWAAAEALMDRVQMSRDALHRYPSQFSGGQRQRLAIARALACKPNILVADEAVSALDVSIQAQVLELLKEIRDDMGLGLLFITHDLRVAAQLCDRVAVMHRGEIVEQGEIAKVYSNPSHEYTRKLLESAPGRIDSTGANGRNSSNGEGCYENQ